MIVSGLTRKMTCLRRARLGTHRGEFAGKDQEREFLPARNARRMVLLALEDAELLTQEKDVVFLVMISLRGISSKTWGGGCCIPSIPEYTSAAL